MRLKMHDVSLHPINAARSWRRYHRLVAEFRQLLLDQREIASPAERLHHGFGGKINFPDAYILQRLLRKHQPRTILEVGSFLGFSSRWILEVSTPWQAKVVSVDPNVRHRIFDRPADILRQLNSNFISDRLEIVEAFFGEQGACTYSDYENYPPQKTRQEADQIFACRQRVGRTWDRRFDFIFIDGDHEYAAVMRDFEIALNLLTANGCIAFHDAFSWPGVYEALTTIKQQYARSADVQILGKLDHRILQGWFGKSCSGIGVFAPH